MNKYFPNSDYHLDLEIISHPPKEYIINFFLQLEAHKNYPILKDDFIYDEEMDIFVHILNRFPHSEVEDLSMDEVFFYPFMSKIEIKNIFTIKSSESYLLRLRAEQVENNIRLKRTFSKLKKKFTSRWSFSHHFDSKQYQIYLDHLNQERRSICNNIPHGTIHSSDANGVCIQTPFGNIITLSYSLQYFLYYMNLFHFGEQLNIPKEDIFSAFVLAIRIMIGTESLDFEIDSRGKIPKRAHKEIQKITNWQMRFIIGHEYAHHYLNHLNSSMLKSNNRIFDLAKNEKIYTYRQNQEFEADYYSINETHLMLFIKQNC